MLGRNADGVVEDTSPTREEAADGANATSALQEPPAKLADEARELDSASEPDE